MPKEMMMDEEGDMDSLYGEESPAKGETKADTVDQEEAQDDHTALVPMKVLQGKNPTPIKEGDEIVLKAVKVYGDEVEVAYSNTKPSEIGGKSADQEIDEMSSGGAEY